MKSNQTNQQGFTLVEVLITLIATTFIVGLIMFVTFNYWQYSILSQADQETFTERLNASDYLRENIGASSGLITQNSIPDPNAGKPDTDVGGAGAEYWAPNHAVPGTITAGSAGTITPILYYKKYSQNTSNQLIYNALNPYEDEFILYLDTKNNSLKLRTIINPNAVGNKLLTSCPSSIAGPTCPEDKTLITNIDSVKTRYFSRSGGEVNWQSLPDPNVPGGYAGPDNTTVEVVELTLNLSKKAVFQKSNTTSSSTVIRVALRNV